MNGSSTSYMATEADLEKRQWWVIDLAKTDLTLGRLAVKIAKVLMGKHKPTYTPHIDTGDFVVVLNADKVKVSGNKRESMEWQYFTLYPSGQKTHKFSDLIQRDPGRILRFAVKRMIPRSKLGRAQINKLKAYKGTEHPHAAQKPEPLDLKKI
jgi:large subunit ribosomal protein L13